jgi:agmatine deiminase
MFAPCYLNAYVANNAVIAGCFGDDERDEAAKKALEEAFPWPQVITLRIGHIAAGGGGVHCLTQPMPATTICHRQRDLEIVPQSLTPS